MAVSINRLGDPVRPRQAVRRVLENPRWLWRDFAPSLEEARDLPSFYKGLRLWLSVRQSGYTMLGCRRGRTLYRLARDVERLGIPGALLDCGAWNGGSSALLSAGAPSRAVWAFDSFEGLPPPGPIDKYADVDWIDNCRAAEENVREAFCRFAYPERLHVVKGWFALTFPQAAADIPAVALLHADADWYDSILLTLETFYPRVSRGGYVVIDDYNFWKGAHEATEEFRRRLGIVSPLRRIDDNAVYWRKS
jgi:O-methyltransferase